MIFIMSSERDTSPKNRRVRILAVLFWLGVWAAAALAVRNKILLASPWDAAGRLLQLIGEPDFYLAVGHSLLRIGLGFFAGFAAAMIFAAGSFRFPALEEILRPVMSLMKTVPVVSFVVLLLIWWGSSFLAVAICFLVVLPNMYISTLEGLKNTDGELLQMARVFRLSARDRFFYLYRPAIRPFLYSSLKISLGMCWKSGVAAEVIGTPEPSIGESLYMSKVYLDTAGVFAWTSVIVLASLVFTRLVSLGVRKFFDWEPACRGAGTRGAAEPVGPVRLRDVSKSFGTCRVIEHLTADYEPGQVYYLTSPSGSGKTTQLQILAGLIRPDSGELQTPSTVSMVFQEDRLCGDYDAVKNVELVTGDRKRAREALSAVLPEEALGKPCSQLSGGMKRRVAVVRAMEACSALVLLDEPFTGLDADTRIRTEEYISRRREGRTLIVATHTGGRNVT